MTEALCVLPDAPHLLDGLTEALGFLTKPMAIDVLSDVLRVVRLSGAVFFTADFSSPWAVESPPPAALASLVMPGAECVVLFHVLIDGECVVECQSHPAVKMEAGDVIVFPHGHQHTMGSRDAAKPTPIGAVFAGGSRDELPQICFGGGGPESHLVCGYLNCDQRFSPLVGALPTMLLVRSRDDYAGIEAIDAEGRRPTAVPRGTGTWLGTTIKFTINEARSSRPGNTALLGRLTELMFVEILREYMQQLPEDHGGWLAGLNDPHVGKALRLLHASPMRNWTVEELVARGGDFPVRSGRAVHSACRGSADAVPRQLAHAACQAAAARGHAQHPGGRDTCGVRVRGRVQPGVQARHRFASGHVAGASSVYA